MCIVWHLPLRNYEWVCGWVCLGDIDVDAPYLEVYTFSPSKERIKYGDSMYYGASRYSPSHWSSPLKPTNHPHITPSMS